jgi:hypothetical protein
MGLALAATVVKLGADLFGAIGRRRAADKQYEFAKQMANDVIARGEREAEFATMDLARLRGAQTTSIAAQGIDVTQGSAAQIAEQTQRFGEEDINQLRLNAAREAWGIKTQAKLNRTAERNQAFAQGASALTQFGMDPAGGRSLVTRASDAWSSYTARRRVGAAGGPNAIYDAARGALPGGR